jgi:hypothetical protein
VRSDPKVWITDDDMPPLQWAAASRDDDQSDPGTVGTGRLLPVDSDRPDPAAVAAGTRDCRRVGDDARRLHVDVERDPQQALSRARYPLKAWARPNAEKAKSDATTCGLVLAVESGGPSDSPK